MEHKFHSQMILTPTPYVLNYIHDWLHLYYYQLSFTRVHHHHLIHRDQNYYAQQEFHYSDYYPVQVQHGPVQHRCYHLIIQNLFLHQIHIL